MQCFSTPTIGVKSEAGFPRASRGRCLEERDVSILAIETLFA